ncbi:hypothetical protein HQN88_25400 [Paenibacillus qinlingensis]|nr:hypothetical protein [Paenibacillus qinlingensis]
MTVLIDLINPMLIQKRSTIDQESRLSWSIVLFCFATMNTGGVEEPKSKSEKFNKLMVDHPAGSAVSNLD